MTDTTDDQRADRYAQRRAAVRESLPERDLGALLVTGASNIRYLSGFTGSHGALLVAEQPGDDRLATDFRYRTQSEAESPGVGVLIARAAIDALVSHAATTSPRRVGVESEHLSLAAYERVRELEPGLDLVATSGVVEALRNVKDDEELALIAEACRISDIALAAMLPQIAVGMTERAVARTLEALMLEAGADAVSFDTIVASGAHSAIPHHQPTHRRIERGDLLKIDFGAAVAGYHADETRTFVVGSDPAPWQRDLHELVTRAQRAGIDALAVGADVGAVDRAARSVIEDAGLGEEFGHGLGHGVGLDIHEVPFLAATGTGILGDRTPVTVEPGVYLPGRGGVRIEDTLVVRTGGPVSLTTTTRELLVL